MTASSTAGLAELRPCSISGDLAAYGVTNSAPFVCELVVARAGLSGIVDHVSNIEYVRWLDRAAELHADSLGFTRQRLLGEGVMWFVARHEIDYLAEAWPGDRLVIATWVRDMRRVKSWRDYVIARPSDGAVICRAATLWVLVDLETRKPTRIPAPMIESFQAFSSAAAGPASAGGGASRSGRS